MESTLDLRVTLVQEELVWENAEENLKNFEAIVSKLKGQTDIIVLPEMFSTGFSMRPELFAEDMDGSTVHAMLQWAQQTESVICGSLMMRENTTFYNRMLWVQPNGTIHTYDKNHLFRMGEEQLHYSNGHARKIVTYKGWNIALAVCYDLRFPVFLRRTPTFNYDGMLLVANWPERRRTHWSALSQARAIENQCYLAAVNRIGSDGNKVTHTGDSMAYSPLGECLFPVSEEAFVKTVVFSKEILNDYRKSFPVFEDADSFILTPHATKQNNNASD